MIIRYGHIVQAASGNIGGANFVAGTRDTYVRSKRMPKSATSPTQLNRQATAQIISTQWAALSTLDKLAWNTCAAAMPHVNRLGIPSAINGREFYFQRWFRNYAFGGSLITAAVPIPITTSPVLSLAVTNPAAGEFDLTWTNPGVGAASRMLVYAALTGQTYDLRYNYLWKVLGLYSAPTSPLDLGPNLYLNVGTPLLGERVAFRIITRNTTQLDSPPGEASVLCTHP